MAPSPSSPLPPYTVDPSRQHFEPPVGLCISRYRLVKRLGAGHFSVAYLATPHPDTGSVPVDETREDRVVIKLLRGTDGHDEAVFEAERGNLQKANKAPPQARVVRLVEAWVEAETRADA